MSFIVASVGTGIVGGLVGARSADIASQRQADSARYAADTQRGMFDVTQKNLQPWMTAGQGALGQLVSGTQPGGALMPQSYQNYDMSAFQNSPEYQAMMQQNQAAAGAAQNASSLGGGMNSNNMKSLMNWTQGNTIQGYQSGLSDYMKQFMAGNQAREQQFNTLNTLSAGGQNAAAGLGGISAQVGANIGSDITNMGNAQAAGIMGQGQALGGAINTGYNAYLQSQYMNPSSSGGQMTIPGSEQSSMLNDQWAY
jgi:hypothetical protein